MLEDEGARISLAGDGLQPGDVVTGVVAAVRGRVLPDGSFDVAEVREPAASMCAHQRCIRAAAAGGSKLPSCRRAQVCFAGPAPQPPLPAPGGEPKYVAIISGLAMGDENANPLLGQLLVDYLSGLLGGRQERETVRRVVRVVVAGGLLKSSAHLSQPTAYSSVRQQGAALGPLRDADMSLTELAGAVPVNVMPGARRGSGGAAAAALAGRHVGAAVCLPRLLSARHMQGTHLAMRPWLPGAGDPANYSLPQQPLHRCLLPGSSPFPTLHRVTNPHDFSVDGVAFLGTSGQNVDDVFRWGRGRRRRGGERGSRGGGCGAHPCAPSMVLRSFLVVSRCSNLMPLCILPFYGRYSDIEDRTAILERLLRWRHLIPTAPDTLAAYPYYDADPFIITSTPHVLFAGGQPAFASALVPLENGDSPGVRVVAVPNFSSTGTIVLVNLQTLEVRPVQFDASM